MATPVLMPRQGQSVESCILTEWSVKPGDEVAEGAIIGTYETDKASFELEAPASGTIIELFYDEGEDIPVLINIAAIGEPGEDVSSLKTANSGASAPAPAAEEKVETPSPEPAAATAQTTAPISGSSTAVSPRARNLAAKEGLAASAIAGTGPGGRVIERDVAKAAAESPHLSPAAREAAAAGLSAPAVGSRPGGMVLSRDLSASAPSAIPGTAAVSAEDIEIPVTGVRKIIAQRMLQSLTTTAQLTLNRSFNATSLQGYRAAVKAKGEALGLPNITINDLIAYAVAKTLLKHRSLNAHFLGDKIVQFGSVNLGIAMDTPRGLMVPVFHGAHHHSLAQLSATIKPVVADAQKGSVNPDLLVGGTFTITNMGMLGIETFTPVLNAPEVAILGVGGLTQKPVVENGEIKVMPAINLSLTVDHQAVDGADGARFLKDLADLLENIELALAQ